LRCGFDHFSFFTFLRARTWASPRRFPLARFVSRSNPKDDAAVMEKLLATAAKSGWLKKQGARASCNQLLSPCTLLSNTNIASEAQARAAFLRSEK
jgi:hypothetical protein